jgi:GcrA cell cycle regulator
MAWRWSDEEKRLVAKSWRQGLSASQITQLVGNTRNAIIGLIHRLGLSRPREPRQDRPKPSKPSKPQPLRAAQAVYLNGAPTAPPMPAEDRPPPPIHKPVSLMGLKQGMCKWPVTAGPPHRFCGAPVDEGYPYCGQHRLRAYDRRRGS